MDARNFKQLQQPGADSSEYEAQEAAQLPEMNEIKYFPYMDVLRELKSKYPLLETESGDRQQEADRDQPLVAEVDHASSNDPPSTSVKRQQPADNGSLELAASHTRAGKLLRRPSQTLNEEEDAAAAAGEPSGSVSLSKAPDPVAKSQSTEPTGRAASATIPGKAASTSLPQAAMGSGTPLQNAQGLNPQAALVAPLPERGSQGAPIDLTHEMDSDSD